MSVLEDLVKSIQQPKKEVRRPKRQVRKSVSKKFKYIKKSGDGGIIMDFGNESSLHPSFKAYENLMNQHVDPTQLNTANYQAESFEKALGDYVEMGEQAYESKVRAEGAKAEVVNNKNFTEAKKSFAGTEANVGGEKVVATSETDAAILEMFKNNELE